MIRISSHEWQHEAARNPVSVRTKVSRQAIEADPNLIMERVRGSGLSAGDTIRMQCMNEDCSALLCQALFVITRLETGQRRVNEGGVERTLTTTNYTVERCSDWWESSFGKAGEVKAAAVTAEPTQPGPEYIKGSGEVKWNPGKKEHEVRLDGKAIFSTPDKDLAVAIARGDKPIPAEAPENKAA